MLYSSLENKKIKELKKLQTKKYRDQTNSFLVEGPHIVEEAYKNGYLKELLLEENTKVNLDIPKSYLTKDVIKHISTLETPYKVMGICTKKDPTELTDKILLLDDVQDPGNLGTIIRSAVAFGFHTIILSKCSVDPYSPKVIRATQGMVFSINIIVDDLETVIKNLKENNYKILGTKVTGGNNLKTLEKIKKVAIIMGNEGNGVSQNLLDKCDKYIYIPMSEKCESLNVAISASIIMYELR